MSKNESSSAQQTIADPVIDPNLKGIEVELLTSWKAFVDYVHTEMLDYDTYVWRGHRNSDWKLLPTINRMKNRTGSKSISSKRHMETFKMAARGRRGSNPAAINSDNDWWALGQHHGLATPLLDWTTSPFVAAFFAFAEVEEKQTTHRAIYALHRPSIEGWVRLQKAAFYEKVNENERQRIKEGRPLGLIESQHKEYALPVQFVRPLSDENQRLINQGGLFTRTSFLEPIDEWINENYPDDSKGVILFKFLIPNSEREVCLRSLNRMNINPLSLFPDLTGASLYSNLYSEIEHY